MAKPDSEHASDHAHVLLPPPVLYLGVLIGGMACQWLWRLEFPVVSAGIPAGTLLIGAGAILAGWGMWEFRRARTHIPPHRPTLAVIESGPFRYTRNPLYVALNLLAAGIGLAMANPWILILQVPAIVILHFGVIRREEAYLATKFGRTYLDYKGRVRRWL